MGRREEKLQTLTLSPLLGGSSLGGTLGARWKPEGGYICQSRPFTQQLQSSASLHFLCVGVIFFAWRTRSWGVAGRASDFSRASGNSLHFKEEHSMDQCLSRLKLSENFERHWSILFSGEIHMDQSWSIPFPGGKFVWTNGHESSSKSFPRHWYWSMAGSSQDLPDFPEVPQKCSGDFPGTLDIERSIQSFPRLPWQFSVDFPGPSRTVDIERSIQRFPTSSPDFPGSSTDLPRSNRMQSTKGQKRLQHCRIWLVRFQNAAICDFILRFFLQSLQWELRFWICDVKTQRLRLRFFGALSLAQPDLSRSNGGHPRREGTNLGVFVPIWLVLNRCEATNLGVFDLCYFALLKRGCANSGGFGARWVSILFWILGPEAGRPGARSFGFFASLGPNGPNKPCNGQKFLKTTWYVKEHQDKIYKWEGCSQGCSRKLVYQGVLLSCDPVACDITGFGPPARNRGNKRKNIGNGFPQKSEKIAEK